MLRPIQLAQEFQTQFKNKYHIIPYSLKNVVDSKWWKHIENFAYNSKLNDENEFAKELFSRWNSDKVLYPYVLSTSYSKEIENFILNKSNKIKELSDKEYIVITLNKAKKWSKEKNITSNQLTEFLNDDMCIFRALRGDYYKPIFMFSNKFLVEYGELTEEDVLKKRSIKAFFPKVYDSIKLALGTNFVE